MLCLFLVVILLCDNIFIFLNVIYLFNFIYLLNIIHLVYFIIRHLIIYLTACSIILP